MHVEPPVRLFDAEIKERREKKKKMKGNHTGGLS